MELLLLIWQSSTDRRSIRAAFERSSERWRGTLRMSFSEAFPERLPEPSSSGHDNEETHRFANYILCLLIQFLMIDFVSTSIKFLLCQKDLISF
jgi:hypothetical protein